ncbi:hypothetical protein OSI80_07575, partial [Mycobacterium ulcerans]
TDPGTGARGRPGTTASRRASTSTSAGGGWRSGAVAAPGPAAAPLLLQAGGKGEPTAIDPALTADPVVLPGPPPAPAPAPPAPTVVTGATLAGATQPVAPCCNP